MEKIIKTCLKTIVEYPKSILVVLALVFGFFATWVDDFQLDASSDSLLLEGDQDLRFYKDIKARYGDDEFLLVTYQPEKDLFANETLSQLKKLRDELNNLDAIDLKALKGARFSKMCLKPFRVSGPLDPGFLQVNRQKPRCGT